MKWFAPRLRSKGWNKTAVLTSIEVKVKLFVQDRGRNKTIVHSGKNYEN